jgi:hypothetical protein
MKKHFLSKRLAHQLGYIGLIPFIAFTLACWTVHPDWLGDFMKGQMAYGIAILSFLGGIHWGASLVSGDLSAQQTRRALCWSAFPTVIAWSATMAGGFGFAVLMAGFVVAYQVDKRLFVWYRLPDWVIRLRLVLTWVVVAALALSVIAANVRG